MMEPQRAGSGAALQGDVWLAPVVASLWVDPAGPSLPWGLLGKEHTWHWLASPSCLLSSPDPHVDLAG